MSDAHADIVIYGALEATARVAVPDDLDLWPALKGRLLAGQVGADGRTRTEPVREFRAGPPARTLRRWWPAAAALVGALAVILPVAWYTQPSITPAAAAPGLCLALDATPLPTNPANRQARSDLYMDCGLTAVGSTKPDVAAGLHYFQQADLLTPHDSRIAHQIDLAQRYLHARQTLYKPDIGKAITELEWFFDQPDFDLQPYADTPALLYGAYVASGSGYTQVAACDLARARFDKALALPFVADRSAAEQGDAALNPICGTPVPTKTGIPAPARTATAQARRTATIEAGVQATVSTLLTAMPTPLPAASAIPAP